MERFSFQCWLPSQVLIPRNSRSQCVFMGSPINMLWTITYVNIFVVTGQTITLRFITQWMLSLIYSFHLEPQVAKFFYHRFILFPVLTPTWEILSYLLALIRRTKGYPMDTTFIDSMYCWGMGSYWSQSWRCLLLANQFGMGDGAGYTILKLSEWCDSCSVSGISFGAQFWKICSGGTSIFGFSFL